MLAISIPRSAIIALIVLILFQMHSHCWNIASSNSINKQSNCGDAIVEQREQCDDGNNNNGDGCSFDCRVEPNYYCKVANRQSVCCNSLAYLIDSANQCQILCNDGSLEPYQRSTCNKSCNPGEYYNQSSQSCTRLARLNTVSRHLQTQCGPGKYWDEELAGCLKGCAGGYLYDLKTNTCINSCPNGTFYNRVLEMCQSRCPAGLSQSMMLELCFSLCSNSTITYFSTMYTIRCPNGSAFDVTQINALNICPPGTIPVNGSRICIQRCNGGSIYNNVSQICVCPQSTQWNETTFNCTNMCSDGAFYNFSSSKCQNICPNGTVFNASINNCSIICPKGVIFNYFTNKCEDICAKGQLFIPIQQMCMQPNPSSFQISSYTKVPHDNAISLVVDYSAGGRLLIASNLEVTADFPYQNIAVQYRDSYQFEINIKYNQSLNNLDKMTVSVNNAMLTLPPTTDNNLALKYYSQDQYKAYQVFDSLMPIFTYCVIFLLAITFAFSSKLIAMETLLIFQFTYGGLIMMKKIQAIMFPYQHLWIFDGINIFINDGANVPPRIQALNLHGDFFSNFNIDFVFCLLPLVVGSVLLLVFHAQKKIRRRQRSSLKKNGERCFGDWQLSALLLCIQQLIFSYVINIQYGLTPIAGIIVGSLLLLVYGYIGYSFYSQKKSGSAMHSIFGDYKSFFEANHANFYIWVMLYRASLSLILVLMSEYIISQILALLWTSSWLAYLIIKRPYKKSACLIPIINSSIMVLLAIFFLYQRNKADDAYINFATYIPIAVIILLGLTCIFNSIYAGINFHKVHLHKKRRDKIQKEMKQNQKDLEFQLKHDTIDEITGEAQSGLFGAAHQENTIEVNSENVSKFIAGVQEENNKNNHERPTTALKDLSPIRPERNKSELIIQSGDISEIKDKIKAIQQLVNQENKSDSLANQI